jgi:hypothetical protein
MRRNDGILMFNCLMFNHLRKLDGILPCGLLQISSGWLGTFAGNVLSLQQK